MKPKEVNILGVIYTITYVEKPSDVDIFKRESLWGQIDYWTRTIRVYDYNTNLQDIWQTLFHEIIHGITDSLKLKEIDNNNTHDEIDLLALGLIDTLIRNNWFNPLLEDKK